MVDSLLVFQGAFHIVRQAGHLVCQVHYCVVCFLHSLGQVLASLGDLVPWRTGRHITPSSGAVHLPQKLITRKSLSDFPQKLTQTRDLFGYICTNNSGHSFFTALASSGFQSLPLPTKLQGSAEVMSDFVHLIVSYHTVTHT